MDQDLSALASGLGMGEADVAKPNWTQPKMHARHVKHDVVEAKKHRMKLLKVEWGAMLSKGSAEEDSATMSLASL